MTPERWQQISEIFHGAIAIRDSAAREAYLHDACSDDPLLRAEIDSLIAAHGDGTVSIDAALGVAGSATTQLAAGTMLGPYRVEELLGAGGMGEVYRAHDSRLGRTVAVKILPPHLRASPQLLARFEREARAVGSLNHPYICTLHDVGREQGIDFLVMELIEGETLSNRLRRGRLAVDESVRISAEVAEALAAAHDKGIIHRDIKPSNIILPAGGHVKVVDFGLARTSALFQDDRLAKDMSTQTEVIAGTPRYMSPEQALGQPLDPRTDIFSLGVVLFECLTGELPFEGTTKFEYLQNVLSGKAKSVASLRADVPDHLRTVLSRCLEREASRRLDSARWLATELGRIADGSGPPFSPRLVRWTVFAVALVALAALLVIWWPRNQPAASAGVPLLRQFTTAAGDEFDSHLSPDGTWMSFISIAGGEPRLNVGSVDDAEQQRRVTVPAGLLQSHVWSSDQKSYACLIHQATGWTIQIVPTPFGSDVPRQSIATPQISRSARLLRWIDRTIYALVEESGRRHSLWRLNLDTGSFEVVSGPWTEMTVGGLDVRPDGRQVVWSAGAAGTHRDDLWLADLDGGGAAIPLTGPEDDSFKRFPLWNGLGTSVIYQSTRGGQVDLWEIDIKTRRSIQRTTDRAVEKPESSSKDGSISYQLSTQKTALWIWSLRDGNGTQVSDEGLSDFAPSASHAGSLRVAFQRSLPSPNEGYLQVDSDIFIADVSNPAARLVGAKKVGTGLAPQLSPDGRRLAYQQRNAGTPGVTELVVRDVESTALDKLSVAVPLPSGSLFPVDWVEQHVTWTSPQDLYFVERTDRSGAASRLLHYRAGVSTKPVPIIETAGRLTDLYASSDGKRIGYLTRQSVQTEKASYQLHTVDLETGVDRVVLDIGPNDAVRFHGWLPDDSGLVLSRSVAFDEDTTGTFELLAISMAGTVQQKTTIDHVAGLSRFLPLHSDLYFIRSVDGIGNLCAYSFNTHRQRQLSVNSVLDVTYGSVDQFGPDHVIGIRHEQTKDIHLLDARARAARSPGHQ